MGIYEPAEIKAFKLIPGKKIPLHTFICSNNRIKTLIQEIISERPDDYVVYEQVNLKNDPQEYNMGKIEQVP